MVVGKEGTFPHTINKRIAEILAYLNSGAAGFLANADSLIINAASIGPVVGSTGIFTRLTTTNVTNVSGDLQYNRQLEPAFHCRFKLSSQTSSRLFIGLTTKTGGTMVASGLPTGDYAGLYMDAGDTTWKFVHSNGGSGTRVDEGTSTDSSIHDFYMWLKKSGGANSVIFQLDNGDRVEVTSNIPSTSALMRPTCEAKAIGVTRSLDIAKVTIIQEA